MATSRTTRLGVGAVVVVLALAGFGALYLDGDRSARTSSKAGSSIQRLLADLQLIVLTDQTPAPFTLDTLDGRRLALGDHAGRPTLVYFWASW